MVYIVAAIAVVFGILRFILPVSGKINKQDIFKDLAHVFVGGVFGAFAGSMDYNYLWIGLALTALEVIAFFVRKSS